VFHFYRNGTHKKVSEVALTPKLTFNKLTGVYRSNDLSIITDEIDANAFLFSFYDN